jgi:hypothetical protein
MGNGAEHGRPTVRHGLVSLPLRLSGRGRDAMDVVADADQRADVIFADHSQGAACSENYARTLIVGTRARRSLRANRDHSHSEGGYPRGL